MYAIRRFRKHSHLNRIEERRYARIHAEHFLKHILKDIDDYNGYCFAASLPFSLVLSKMGIRNERVWGTVNGVAHCWIKVRKGNYIIDLTAGQFSPKYYKKPLIGMKPINYVDRPDSSPGDNQFFDDLLNAFNSRICSKKAKEKMDMCVRADRYVIAACGRNSDYSRHYLNLLKPIKPFMYPNHKPSQIS